MDMDTLGPITYIYIYIPYCFFFTSDIWIEAVQLKVSVTLTYSDKTSIIRLILLIKGNHCYILFIIKHFIYINTIHAMRSMIGHVTKHMQCFIPLKPQQSANYYIFGLGCVGR